jgi:uncharacterized protein
LGRILLLIIIGFAIYLLFRSYLRSQAKAEAKPTAARAPEDMIACARCGVNLPRSSARLEGESWICQGNPHCW